MRRCGGVFGHAFGSLQFCLFSIANSTSSKSDSRQGSCRPQRTNIQTLQEQKILSLVVRRGNYFMSKFRDTYCTTNRSVPKVFRPEGVWGLTGPVQYVSGWISGHEASWFAAAAAGRGSSLVTCASHSMLTAVFGFICCCFFYPGSENKSQASAESLSLSEGWTWISALWYAASHWSFDALLKKPHWGGSKVDRVLGVTKLNNRQPESFHLAETPEETPFKEQRIQQDQCWIMSKRKELKALFNNARNNLIQSWPFVLTVGQINLLII